MKAKQLINMLRGLEDFDLKDCGITYEILHALDIDAVILVEYLKALPQSDKYMLLQYLRDN